MNHTTRTNKNNRKNPWILNASQDNALIAAVVITSALAMSALFIPSQYRPARAASELDLESTHLLCLQTNSSTTCDTLVQKLASKNRPLPAGDPIKPYKPLNNCREAVDYLFNDRTDYARAIEVVYRESTNNPNARRPGSQYAGCAQLSSTLQATFLRGAWNDPYYNVLAMRDAVDDPRWGWCHWDLVNYCGKGGEF